MALKSGHPTFISSPVTPWMSTVAANLPAPLAWRKQVSGHRPFFSRAVLLSYFLGSISVLDVRAWRPWTEVSCWYLQAHTPHWKENLRWGASYHLPSTNSACREKTSSGGPSQSEFTSSQLNLDLTKSRAEWNCLLPIPLPLPSTWPQYSSVGIIKMDEVLRLIKWLWGCCLLLQQQLLQQNYLWF